MDGYLFVARGYLKRLAREQRLKQTDRHTRQYSLLLSELPPPLDPAGDHKRQHKEHRK
jgi:hypothetical protein